jgi:hypothetical protein
MSDARHEDGAVALEAATSTPPAYPQETALVCVAIRPYTYAT